MFTPFGMFSHQNLACRSWQRARSTLRSAVFYCVGCHVKRTTDLVQLMSWALLLIFVFCALHVPAVALAEQFADRLSVADVNPRGSPEKRDARFEQYRRAGIGMLRVDEGEWRTLETAPDSWNVAPEIAGFVTAAQRFDFGLKIGIGAFQGPPTWFFKMHPDAQLVGQSGAPNEAPLTSANVISLWYPKLFDLLETKDDQIFAYLRDHHLLGAVRYIVVPGGPAGEPLYPAPWTTSDPNGPPRFWFYDQHAQASFSGAMRMRYGSIAAANSAWGSSFADWPSVKIPLPGQVRGRMWEDVLTWYRDSKRAFFRWQIAHYDRLRQKYWGSIDRPRLLVLVPGEHVRPSMWNEAVRTGGGESCVRAMCDSEFLLDTAASYGAWAQYTGLPAMAELEYLQSYIRAHRYPIELWGENVGNVGVPRELAAEVLGNGLYGQEYVGSNLFANDQVTPLPKFTELAAAYSQLRSVWAGQEHFQIGFGVTTLISGACLYADRNAEHELCMDATGHLVLLAHDRILWRSELRGGDAGHCVQTDSCRADFQGDGNLVIYDGTKVLWNSETSGSHGRLVVSDVEPFVKIEDSAGRVLWSPRTRQERH